MPELGYAALVTVNLAFDVVAAARLVEWVGHRPKARLFVAALGVRDRRTETKSGRTLLVKYGKYAGYENYGRTRFRRKSDAT